MPKMLRTKTRLIIFHCNTVKGIVMYTECGSFWKSMINIWIIHDVYYVYFNQFSRGCLGILNNVIYAELKRDINNECGLSSKHEKMHIVTYCQRHSVS